MAWMDTGHFFSIHLTGSSLMSHVSAPWTRWIKKAESGG